ncbi:hypothetical protein RMCBS344292_08322 [Rhizopus microsporus]|nr:hypothetical protein RMCBS344292_08322 [Rhizopus microsporus]
MSFLAGGSADCGPVNPMSGLLKQFQQDRSLQQDRFAPDQRGESSKAGFRTQSSMNRAVPDNRQFTEEFFKEEMAMGRATNGPFEFSGLSRELDQIQPNQPPAAEWAADFMQHQHEITGPQQFEEFEQIYQQNQHHPVASQPFQSGNWTKEFSDFQANHPGAVLSQTERAAFEKAFDEARQGAQLNWEQEFTTQESWASEFAKEEQEDKPMVATNDNEALARTAAMLLDSVDVESNPKFKNSQFMNLMRKLRDSEVQIEGNQMVETKGKNVESSWASEFESSQRPGHWADEFAQHAGSSRSGNMWSSEFAKKMERGWADEFQGHQQPLPGNWASEFSKQSELTTEQMNELFGKGTETEDWVEQYHRNISHLKQSQDHEWDAMQKDWERFKPEQGLGYRATNPQYDVYKFTVNNPYLLNPGLIDGKTHDTLADSILALEAKAQLQTQDSDAWKMLGIRQQENERDAAAIAALRQAVKLNPSLVDAWLALAVSYTNENCRADAYDALEQWMLNHDQYQHLAKSHGKGKMTAEGRHEYITSMFLEAARSSPGAEMDADVQVGLGVLFNVSEEYEKAIDCFRAALHSRPQDYKLWNKLGATLANSRNPTGAIEAYFTALEINPNYVRARYNLAISCMNLGQHREAAEHLLTALALQQSNDNATGGGAVMIDDHGNTVNIPGGMSENVWSSLRMLMLTMNRDDMVKHCDNHNLDAFRAEFDF